LISGHKPTSGDLSGYRTACVRVADHPLGATPENPVYIDCPGLKVPILSFQGDVMFRGIVILFSLIACLVVESQVAAQQAPSAAAQPAGARGADQALRLLLRCSLERPGVLWDQLMRLLLMRSSSPTQTSS
jgi:hypothetical protein